MPEETQAGQPERARPTVKMVDSPTPVDEFYIDGALLLVADFVRQGAEPLPLSGERHGRQAGPGRCRKGHANHFLVRSAKGRGLSLV